MSIVPIASAVVDTRSLERGEADSSDLAATRIQARIRGVLSRKSLPPEIYFEQQYGKLMRMRTELSYTKATTGNTPVWFPQVCAGIIMKFSPCARSRLEQMNDIRETIQSQRSSHLIVPRARTCEREGQTILVEERLPVNTDPYYNMWLYPHHLHAFDNVVRELVMLYSAKGGLGDLYGDSCHPLMQLENTGYGIRFDNFPLYLNSKGEGCVGLIDLEQMGTQDFVSGCQTLARIFPFHTDFILDEATKCGYALDREVLELRAQEGKEALEAGIRRHKEWIYTKVFKQCSFMGVFSVIVNNPITLLPRQRKVELIGLVRQKLTKSHEKQGITEENNLYRISDKMSDYGQASSVSSKRLYNPLDKGVDIDWMHNPYVDFSHPEVSANTLATNLTLFILKYFEEAISKCDPIPLVKIARECRDREWSMIRDRSPTIDFVKLHNLIEKMVAAHKRHITNVFVDIETMNFPDIDSKDFVDVIMKDLISHEEIFSCDRISDGCYWLRY